MGRVYRHPPCWLGQPHQPGMKRKCWTLVLTDRGMRVRENWFQWLSLSYNKSIDQQAWIQTCNLTKNPTTSPRLRNGAKKKYISNNKLFNSGKTALFHNFVQQTTCLLMMLWFMSSPSWMKLHFVRAHKWARVGTRYLAGLPIICGKLWCTSAGLTVFRCQQLRTGNLCSRESNSLPIPTPFKKSIPILRSWTKVRMQKDKGHG